MQPLIGMTGARHVIDTASGPSLLAVASADDYAQGVEKAGGVPIVIPYVEDDATVTALAERLDGLLLAGGEDIDPAMFGEEPKVGLGEVVPERDLLERRLIHAMMAQGKPILGICRGIQVLNAALGGTLYQDLPRDWKGHMQHRQKARRDHLSHDVHIQPGTKLYELLGRQARLRCNSFHHQAVKDVAKPLVPIAWDAEGLVEAVEHPDYPFMVAVQWHPENLWRTHSEFLGLFAGLVNAAAVAVAASK